MFAGIQSVIVPFGRILDDQERRVRELAAAGACLCCEPLTANGLSTADASNWPTPPCAAISRHRQRRAASGRTAPNRLPGRSSISHDPHMKGGPLSRASTNAFKASSNGDQRLGPETVSVATSPTPAIWIA